MTSLLIDPDLTVWDHAADVGDGARMTGRIVMSPVAGDWTPGGFGDLQHWSPCRVAAGTVLGTIGDHEVVSPIDGHLAGMLVLAGERLRVDEPIAWVVPS